MKRVGIVAPKTGDDDRYVIRPAYVQQVLAAGAVPLILPYLPIDLLPRVLELFDGILFAGGGDVDPARVGRPGDPAARLIDPERDECELALWSLVLASGMPSLAICRGVQLMNVAAGGDLVIDIARDRPDADDHETGLDAPGHGIKASDGTRLGTILDGRPARVNSAHHQAVDTIAPGFVASGVADDGIVECLESVGPAFHLGVQWHPEVLPVDSPVGGQIFAAFVAAL